LFFQFFLILILDKTSVSFALFKLGFLNKAFLLVFELLVICIHLIFLPREIKEELLLIKYYDIVKGKLGTVSSENEFKN